MAYLLNVVYVLLLIVASPWLLVSAIRKGKYREGWGAKFLGRVPVRAGNRRCLWFHAVSVGEVNLLAPLLRRIAQCHPDWQCVVSTTTRTGMALARKKYPELAVFYCPLDFSWAVRRAMRRVRPDLLVLAELELWPNLVSAARQAGSRVAVINGRLSEHSFRGYRRIRALVRRVLDQIDVVAVQDETYADRFRALGAREESVHVTGSMKFDGAQTDRTNPATARLARLAGIGAGDIVLLAGSTQEEDETAALAAYRALSPRWPALRLILVPRHPERFDAVARWLDDSGLAWQRRSRLDAEPARPDARILLVDTVGELGAWWGTAQIALVGGGLGRRGGQNMIEPAAYGAAVAFGPNTWNFRDIVAMLLAHQAAVVVPDAAGLTDFAARCLSEPALAAGLGQRAQALVVAQAGATARTLDLLAGLLQAQATQPQGHGPRGPVPRRPLPAARHLPQA